ncbi:MAG: SPOR domain-containing protein [Desulfovibrio sp.]|jgi:cell division protein FtsN|nr:SPOR domain-containing protein [Desulfovibrio sp.]
MPQSSRRSRTKSKRPENGAGRFTVSFSKAAAAMLGLVLVVTVTWAFFMGFMVGRGQNPVQRVEQMAAILRDDGPATPETSGYAQNGQPAGPPAAASAAEAASGRNPASGEGVAPESGSTVPSAEPVKQKTDLPRSFDPLNPPEGTALAAWGIRDASAGVASGQRGAKAEKNPPPSAREEPQFNWVFQMAAFRDRVDAERLQTRLGKAGYSVGLTRSGKMTLVMVRLRGGKAEAERLRGQAREYGLGEPLLQSRRPVSDGKAKR